MNTVKKKILIAIDVEPIKHASEVPWPTVGLLAHLPGPFSATAKRVVAEVEIDVPVLYECVPAESIKVQEGDES